MPKNLWQTLSVAALSRFAVWVAFFISLSVALPSCSTIIPNIEAVSPTSDIPGVAALGQDSNSPDHRRLTLDEWLDFLYAQPERPDPKHPGQVLPAKGPAVCASSVDWGRNETAIAQLCIHGKCTYEQKQALEQAIRFRRAIYAANQRRMKIPYVDRIELDDRYF